MGLAIAGMHYTGMAAARFTAMEQMPGMDPHALPPSELAIAVAIVGLLVAGMALIAACSIASCIRARRRPELRAAKEAAEETSRAKSDFLSNMSHELRTPLNSVIGFANIILKNKKGNLTPQDIAWLGRITANGEHLLSLINGILDLSKVEAGRMDLEIASVDLAALVRETVLELEGQTMAKSVTLVADVPAGLHAIETDAGKLKQMLINLIGNALKFTARGTVTVRVVRNEWHAARIDVVDSGVGIPGRPPGRDLRPVSSRLIPAPRASTAGSGLGLTITPVAGPAAGLPCPGHERGRRGIDLQHRPAPGSHRGASRQPAGAPDFTAGADARDGRQLRWREGVAHAGDRRRPRRPRAAETAPAGPGQ